jgi:N-acetylmuramoyl-L-alanine amidase
MSNNIKIAVDAGHGSNTPGKRTPPMPQDIDFDDNGIIDVSEGVSIREHIANVGVAIYLIEALERSGFSIIRTGFNDSNAYDDDDEPLSSRQQIIRSSQCDYSVSIHFNAFGDGTSFNNAEGVSVLIHSIYPEDSYSLANDVLNYLIEGTSQRNRGIRTAQLAMCNCRTMDTKASILVECAFMTNLNEALNMMGNQEFWKETGIEIAKGICEYTGEPYVEETLEEPSDETTLYKVQIGAFQNKYYADALVAKAKALGFTDAFANVVFVNNKPLYRVQIGAFSDKANAERMLAQAISLGFTDAFIHVD